MAVVFPEHTYIFQPQEVLFLGNVNVTGTINAEKISFAPDGEVVGNNSVAFASNSIVVGDWSLAQGLDHELLGDTSFMGGQGSYLEGNHSFSYGLGLTIQGNTMTALGRWNNVSNALLVVGNGSNLEDTSDGLVLYENGNLQAGDVTLGRLTFEDQTSSKRDVWLQGTEIRVGSDMLIAGNLSVVGQVANVYSETKISDQVLIENLGTGPALIVNQRGQQHIAEFKDDDVTVLKIHDGGRVVLGNNITTAPSEVLVIGGNVIADAFIGNVFTGSLVGTIDTTNIPFGLADGHIQVVDTKVCIGTTTPIDKLTIQGNIVPTVDATYSLGSLTNSWENLFVTNVVNPSDSRLKKDIASLPFGLDLIDSIEPVQYAWNDGRDHKTHYGLIAQQVERALDGLGIKNSAMCLPGHGPETYRLNYIELISPLVRACQELHGKIQGLEARLAALEHAPASASTTPAQEPPEAAKRPVRRRGS